MRECDSDGESHSKLTTAQHECDNNETRRRSAHRRSPLLLSWLSVCCLVMCASSVLSSITDECSDHLTEQLCSTHSADAHMRDANDNTQESSSTLTDCMWLAPRSQCYCDNTGVRLSITAVVDSGAVSAPVWTGLFQQVLVEYLWLLMPNAVDFTLDMILAGALPDSGPHSAEHEFVFDADISDVELMTYPLNVNWTRSQICMSFSHV